MSNQIIGPGPTGGYLNAVNKGEKKKITPSPLPDTNKAKKRMKEIRVSNEKKKENVVVVNVDKKAIQQELKNMVSGLVTEIKNLKIKVNDIEKTIRNYGIYR